MVKILKPKEKQTVYDLVPCRNNGDTIRFYLEPESKVKQLRIDQVDTKLDTNIDTGRVITFIREARDNSIELLGLIESESQTKKTRAIAGIYRAEIKEAELLVAMLNEHEEERNLLS